MNDVKNDKIKDKNNSAWAKDKITMADFYTYLSGTNGNNGKSTYELWKETVGTGNINDPKIQDKNGLLTKFQNMIFSII